MIKGHEKVLLIYTGGTIGMIENTLTGSLEPFDFSHIESHVPEIQKLSFKVDTYLFDPPIDSSNITPDKWCQMMKIVEENYDEYGGFVILHGTDTMSYTASALSFLVENLTKPIVLTGSQLPICKIRTDGKENLITALQIAADKDCDGRPFVPEVTVYFQNTLMRGSRTTKISAEDFHAFDSLNYPPLADVGVTVKYLNHNIHKPDFDAPVIFNYNLNENIFILKLFPGMNVDILDALLLFPNLKGLILETYGTGNAPSDTRFLEKIKRMSDKEIVIIAVSQCHTGCVHMNIYESGRTLQEAGVISGYDLTTESAVAKLMFLLGNKYTYKEVVAQMHYSLRGEQTMLER